MMSPFIMHKRVDVVIVEIRMHGIQLDFVLIMDRRHRAPTVAWIWPLSIESGGLCPRLSIGW
jgi:hypothetical protein